MMRNFPIIILLLFTTTVHGQKREEICEFVALVNNSIITRAAYLAALKEHKEELARQMSHRDKKGLDIDAEFERTKPTILNTLIDDLLLDQKAAEMRLDDDVEVKKMLENTDLLIHPDYRDESDAFEKALMSQGIDIEQSRSSLRKKILRQAVIQREVLAPIFESITDEDRRNYYTAHKEEFMFPAKVTLSKIFLPFDGHSETVIEHSATDLLVKLRAGADFIKAVKENTPVSRTSYSTEGYLGSFAIEDLRERVSTAVSTLNSGEFTEPIRLDEGYMIIRLDARIPATLRSHDQPEVQQAISRAITLSRGGGARKNYIAELRKNAQIQICSNR